MMRVDRHAVADLASAWGSAVHASDMLTRDKESGRGLVIQLPSGDFTENPWYTKKRRALNKVHRYLTEFGMTPASRKRRHGSQ